VEVQGFFFLTKEVSPANLLSRKHQNFGSLNPNACAIIAAPSIALGTNVTPPVAASSTLGKIKYNPIAASAIFASFM
jgi:hypothetical protein